MIKKIHTFENSPPPITFLMVRPLEQVFPTTLVCNNFHTLKLKACVFLGFIKNIRTKTVFFYLLQKLLLIELSKNVFVPLFNIINEYIGFIDFLKSIIQLFM